MAVKRTIHEQFIEYHNEHPEVFDLFYKFSLELKNAGFKHYGAKAIMERIRWHHAINHGPNEPFKISNNYTSRYARLLMKYDTQFVGFFRLKPLKRV